MTVFGALHSSLLDLLVCLALLYILYRIPTWILSSVRMGGGGRSMVGSLIKGFVMAKAFGMISGRHRSGPATTITHPSAGVPARRTGAPRDPAWPARVHHWYGPDGPRSPAAVEQRMRAWQASERAHRRPRSTVGPARFIQPSPGTPTHDLATHHAATNPGMPEFRTAHTTPPPRPLPTPAGPPAVQFQAPPGFRPTPPVIHTAAVPAQLRFHPSTPPTPVPVVHAHVAPPSPSFQAAGEDVHLTRRARTQTPTPVTFPTPPTTPASRTATPPVPAAPVAARPGARSLQPAPATAMFSSPRPVAPASRRSRPRRWGGDQQ